MIEQLREKVRDIVGRGDDVAASTGGKHVGMNAGVEPAENLLAFTVALGMTFLARSALQAGWRKALKTEPPKNPSSHEVMWRDALLWGAVSGAVVGVARIASRRASSSAYRGMRS
ncbi:DUF4235 domain-containing protein [Planctomycetes bacterium K23_9]|uniref:DUF4235 domain-containing protein n=1 Tax=Stieleria marina TaxID=1930275 RepID=A0A517NXX1_9BACT|nr:hypothetical protein K239x_39520 [Planctomycetes bacterium K23_9]